MNRTANAETPSPAEIISWLVKSGRIQTEPQAFPWTKAWIPQ